MISMISAIGMNNEIGKKNSLIWHIPRDMKFFKETTMGHKVIMGRNTYASLPGKLVGREMIVLSTSLVDNEVTVVPTVNKIVEMYKNSSEEVFIIGGAKVYSEFIDYADRLYLTEIAATTEDADAYFPKFNKKNWKKTILEKGDYNNVSYTMCMYERKKGQK